MTTTQALAKLHKAIVGTEGKNSVAKNLESLAANWSSSNELPAVSGTNNGKVLKVVEGVWAIGTDSDTTYSVANVAKAAGEAPTKAEFDALIDALVEAGLMASAS